MAEGAVGAQDVGTLAINYRGKTVYNDVIFVATLLILILIVYLVQFIETSLLKKSGHPLGSVSSE